MRAMTSALADSTALAAASSRLTDCPWTADSIAAHPVVLIVEPLVQPLKPRGELAVERAEAGGQAVKRGRDRGGAVEGVEPLADVLQGGGGGPLLQDVVVHRPREQFAHPVGGYMLTVVTGGAGLAGTQQQVVVARLVHRAPSSKRS